VADVLEWPDICPASLSWGLSSNTKTFRSPFNGTTQVARYPGSRWLCTMTISNQNDTQARRVEAMLALLDGEYGRVKIRDWGRDGRTPSGSPAVDGANQTGSNLYSNGWTASALVLRLGDYITVNDELKMVTADVTSSATGTAIIPVAPILRESPPNGAVIEVRQPYGIFKLKDSSSPVMGERTPGVFTSFSIEFEEAF
jgi:hypothetical protein